VLLWQCSQEESYLLQVKNRNAVKNLAAKVSNNHAKNKSSTTSSLLPVTSSSQTNLLLQKIETFCTYIFQAIIKIFTQQGSQGDTALIILVLRQKPPVVRKNWRRHLEKIRGKKCANLRSVVVVSLLNDNLVDNQLIA